MSPRICVDVGKTSSLLLTNPLVAAQNFEASHPSYPKDITDSRMAYPQYKTSNILDKPLEVEVISRTSLV